MRAAVGIVEVVVDGANLVHQLGLVDVAFIWTLVISSPLVVARR
jgi:hypothetical protein